MKKISRGLLSAAVTALMLSACTSPEESKPNNALKIFSSDQVFVGEHPQCKSMLDGYCTYLYSPDVLGNLEVKRPDDPIHVLQGETANEFTQVFYNYAMAKLQNRRFLPHDFYQALERANYFEKMEKFLARRSRQQMTKAQRLSSDATDYELGSLWSAAINETVLNRMDVKFPGFHNLPDYLIPVELDLERTRLRRSLTSEIARSIWRNNKNWQKVEHGFAKLQDSFVEMIARLDIPEALRKEWTEKILTIQLVMPGALPAISDEMCSTTTVNAYYYTNLNMLTVCAGDFNSEDAIQTLAHEMAHALGIDREQFLFESNSSFGRDLASLRGDLCTKETFSCDKWTQYKAGFEKEIDGLSAFQPSVPEFQRCLKRRETPKKLSDDDVQRFARALVSSRMSDLASSGRFLRITKPDLPMINGKTQKNPNYLNPCSYYLFSHGQESIDDDLTTLMYFTAEYRCSDQKPSERMKTALEVAKTMTARVFEGSLRMEGEFSPRDQLENEGFSSPPYERFADVIGSYAMAQYLAHLPFEWDRQNKFLASSSWQCSRPSLATHFPEESAVEKEYVLDAHAEGDQRRMELFSTPIRKVIGCEKDFEFKECSLPFKEDIKIHPPQPVNVLSSASPHQGL